MTHQPIHAASDQQPAADTLAVVRRLETTTADTTQRLDRLRRDHAGTVAQLDQAQQQRDQFATTIRTVVDALGLGPGTPPDAIAPAIAALTADRDQARAERDEARRLAEFRRNTRALAHDEGREAGAEIERLRGVIRRQAEQIQHDGTTLMALRSWWETGGRLWDTHSPLDAEHESQPDPELAATHRQIAADAAQLQDGLAAGLVVDEMGAPPPAASVPVAGAPEPSTYSVAVRRLDGSELADGRVVVSAVSDAATPAAALDQVRQLIAPESAGEVETLRAERDGLRVELARALDRNRAELEVIGAAVAVRRAWADDLVAETDRAERALTAAVNRLERTTAPATIAAERPAGPDGQSDVDGPDPKPQTVTQAPACPHGYTVYAGKHPDGKPCTAAEQSREG